MCVAGLVSSLAAQTQPSKTQAGYIAAKIRTTARAGDVVVYCPDQLAPAVSRLLPSTLVQRAFPVGASVATVDWVDYARRNALASPAKFAASVNAVAQNATIWLVDVPHGYATFGTKCGLLQQLLSDHRLSRRLVTAQPHRYYEFANLLALTPSGTTR
jgi:hypothetical protein